MGSNEKVLGFLFILGIAGLILPWFGYQLKILTIFGEENSVIFSIVLIIISIVLAGISGNFED